MTRKLHSQNLAQLLLAQPELLQRYCDRKISASDIAERFGYEATYVLSTLSRLGVKRPKSGVSTYEIQKKNSELASTRREFRDFLARKVKKNEISLKKAAEIANCSERTIRRYVDKA